DPSRPAPDPPRSVVDIRSRRILMPGRPWRRPSHATIVAYLALFVALGGSAYAATSLPAGSVGATQIRAGAVTGVKLAKGSVTARAVADHSLTGQQIDVSRLGSVP